MVDGQGADDLMARVTGKQRASRIPLDYYKKPDRLARWKLWLSGAVLLGAAAWIGWGSWLGGPGLAWSNSSGRMSYSHGPVARVHAAWDAKCEACHSPFRSISGETWPSAVGMKPEDSAHRCNACHAVADHAPNLIAGEEGSCASCHRDHQGRDFSLVRVADSQCTKCHDNLPSHVKGGVPRAAHADGSTLADHVTGFPGGHPEFDEIMDWAKSEPDPTTGAPLDHGPVRFNHALHMTPGLAGSKADKAIFTLAQLAEADRGRYADQPGRSLDAPVRLECASCHRQGGAASPGASDYQPVTYANDCAACHPVAVPVSAVPPAVANARRPVSTFPLPHGLQPEAVRTLLENASIGESMADAERPDKGAAPVARDLPGRNARTLLKLPPREEVAARVKHAEKLLFGPGKATCTECHRYETAKKVKDELVPGSDLGAVRIAALKPVANAPAARGHRAMMSPVWLGRAKFDHSAHRGVTCASCHAGAYADADSFKPPGTPSRRSDDVLIPGMETCATCHAPEGSDAKTGAAIGGAGHSCVECHRYHGDGHAKGATPTVGREINDFLLGDPAPKAKPAKAK